MIISEVLYAIDNINSIMIESEINTCRSLLYSYDKMLIIEEYYDGNDINGFKIFQEGEKLDLIKEDLKKQNEGKSTLNKILFTIPRLIRSIFRLITGKLKKSSEKAKQVSEKYTKVKSKKNFKPAGVIAALTLGIPIVWKGKDITKYVKDRISKKKKKPVEDKKQSNQQNDGKAENIQKSNENSVIDDADKDQDLDEFMDELFGNDNDNHPGEGLTIDDIFNNDIDFHKRFKNVSKILPIPSYVEYDTTLETLYSSISIYAYINLYNKLFKDFNEYIKNLKNYIVEKKKAPDDNNIKLTEPNIKKTITDYFTDYFEDTKKKSDGEHYRIEFTKINDEIIKIEKQTKDINNEINICWILIVYIPPKMIKI